jgi:uncharacterized protein
MAYLSKPFQLHGKYYVYDTGTHSILAVSEEQYIAINAFLDGNVNDKETELIKQLQDAGYLRESNIQIIEHPHAKNLPLLIERRTEKITLQVTQRCNLRCKYCAYSGLYKNRMHGLKSMTFDTARKGIDYLMSHSVDHPTVDVGFYGGEPLLELDLIEQCIGYIRSVYPGKRCTFSMTTNATLLTPEVYRKIRPYKINLLISLDGPKEVHDKARVFPDGTGSYDVVMGNVNSILKDFPEDKGKFRFNAVVSPQASEACADTLFNLNEITECYDISMTFMSDMGNKEEIAYSERFLAMYQQEICKLLLHMLGRLPKKSIPKLIYNRKLRFNSIYSKMGMQRQMASIGHPSGPCLAGVGRLFMDVNGRFFPCERVSETSDVMNIGDVNNGIDIEKAKFLISPGQTTQEQCKKCWAFIMCSSCAGRSDDDTSLSPQKRLYECQFVEQSKLEELKDICFLKLHGYTFEEVE